MIILSLYKKCYLSISYIFELKLSQAYRFECGNNAMKADLEAVHDTNFWFILDLPVGQKLIGWR